MPVLEKDCRFQKALFYEASGVDAHGTVVVKPYVELDVRWEQTNQEVLDRQGNTIAVDVVLVTDRHIPDGSIFWKGKRKDLAAGTINPTGGFYQSILFKDTPDIKNRNRRRVAFLMRYSDKLPLAVPLITAPSGLSYPSPLNATVGVPISPLSPTVTGTVGIYSVAPALPVGLNLDPITGIISGTPTQSQAGAGYTITATNAGGSTDFVLTISVADPAAGPSDIPAPWTALARGGSPAGAELTINPQGAVVDVSVGPDPRQITIEPGSVPLFFAPPTLEIGNGATIETVIGTNDVTDVDQEDAIALQVSASPVVKAFANASITWNSYVEFDGTTFVELTLTPSGGNLQFNLLRLTYHITNAAATFLTCPFWHFSRGVKTTPQTLQYPTTIGTNLNLYLNHGKGHTPDAGNERGGEQHPNFWLHSASAGFNWWAESLANWRFNTPSTGAPVWIRRVDANETEFEITLVNKAVNTASTLVYRWGITPTPNRPVTVGSTKYRMGTPDRTDPITGKNTRTVPSGFKQTDIVASFGPEPTWFAGLNSGSPADGGKIRDTRAVHDTHWAGAGASQKAIIDDNVSRGFKRARFGSMNTIHDTNTYMAANGGRNNWRRLRQGMETFSSNELVLCMSSTDHRVHFLNEVANFADNFSDLYGALYSDFDQFPEECDNTAHWTEAVDAFGQQYNHWDVRKFRKLSFDIAIRLQNAGMLWIRHTGDKIHPAVHSCCDYIVCAEAMNTGWFLTNPGTNYSNIPTDWWDAFLGLNVPMLALSQIGRAAAGHLEEDNWQHNRQFFDAVIPRGLGFWGGSLARLNNWMSLAYWQREQEAAATTLIGSGIVSWYRMNELSSGDDLIDAGPAPQVATQVGSPTANGSDRTFNGSSQYAHRTLTPLTGSATVTARVRFTDLTGTPAPGTYTILAQADAAGTDVAWRLIWQANKFIFEVSRDGSTLQTVSTPANFDQSGIWYSVCAAYDSVDGGSHIVAASSTAGEFPAYQSGTPGTLNASGADLSVAVTGGSGTKIDYLRGSLDDVALFNRVLTPGEMLSYLYGATI